MNLGQQLGELTLRISDLETLLEGKGIDHSARARGEQAAGQLALERRAHQEEVAGLTRRIGELEETVARQRQQLLERPTVKDLEAAAARARVQAQNEAEAALRPAFDAERKALQAEIARLQGLFPKGTSAQPAKRMWRSRGANGPQAGFCAFEILRILPDAPAAMGFGQIRAQLRTQFTDSNLSVTLHYLARSKQVERSGEPYHYRYSRRLS